MSVVRSGLDSATNASSVRRVLTSSLHRLCTSIMHASFPSACVMCVLLLQMLEAVPVRGPRRHPVRDLHSHRQRLPRSLRRDRVIDKTKTERTRQCDVRTDLWSGKSQTILFIISIGLAETPINAPQHASWPHNCTTVLQRIVLIHLLFNNFVLFWCAKKQYSRSTTSIGPRSLYFFK